MNNTKMDYAYEARKLIHEHTTAMLSGCIYESNSNNDICELMNKELGFILGEKLINKEFTPVEYNNVRNELTKLLDEIFFKSKE